MPLRQLYPDPTGSPDQQEQLRVDIIAVHGLNPRSRPDDEHAWDTWRKPAGPSGRLWLRDDLPAKTPEARIFLYEYNSRLIYGGEKALFIQKADDLLEDIRIQRKKVPHRPIIFIGHSLGGLLIKQALVNAYLNKKYRSIYDAATSLVFFGTPHRGGDETLVSLGSVAARVARKLHVQANTDIEQTLQNGSLFSEILKFQWKQQLLNYKIISFWEGVGDIVSMDSATFGLPGENEHVVKIDAAHSDMCRFDGQSQKDKDNYLKVWNNLEDLYEDALTRDKSHKEREKARWEILNWIYDDPIDARHIAVQDDRRGRGQWFLNEPKYQSWKDGNQQSKLLWCYGIPGSGKTFLFSFTVDDLRNLAEERSYGFAYMYLDYQGSESQTLLPILRCLLKQFAEQNSDVWNNARACRDHLVNEHKLPSVQTLEALLSYAFSRFSKVFIALDALDETNEVKTLRPLLESISRLTAMGAHFILTSRHDDGHVRDTMAREKATRVEVQPSYDDMKAYIEDYIDHDPRANRILSKEERPQIVESLTSGARGMFIPVTFQIQYLCQWPTVGQILKELETIDESMNNEHILDDLYDNAMKKLRAQHSSLQDMAIEVLRWSVSATTRRTLTVTELGIILGLVLCSDSNELDKRYLPDSETILGACASLITIDDVSGQVRMHATVFEYIVRKMPEMKRSCECAIACTKYLSFKYFLSGACRTQDTFNKRRMEYPFLDYAARYLESHVVEHPEPSEQLIRAILRLVKQAGNRESYLQAACADESDSKGFDWYPKASLPVHVACHIGCSQVVNTLIGEDPNSIHSPNAKGQTALHIASIHGHHKVCEMLLQSKASPLVTDRYGWTPLMWAVEEGHAKVVEVLLNHQAKPGDLLKAKTNLGDTLFHIAARHGYLNIAHLLSQEGAEMEVKNNDGETALEIAARESNTQMVNILVAAKDIEATKKTTKMPPLYGQILNGFHSLAEMIGTKHEGRSMWQKSDDIQGINTDAHLSSSRDPEGTTNIGKGKAREVEDTEAKLAAITRENSWPKVAEENSSEEIKEINQFFVPANLFKRVIELSDQQCILAVDPLKSESPPGDSEELESSAAAEDSSQLADERVWICRIESEVNLRCFLEAFPRGRYLVAWSFSYSSTTAYNPLNPLVKSGYQTYNCSVGRACDPAMFIARVTNPSQPFISTNLNHIINPRRTTSLAIPRLTVTETNNPASIIVTGQMSGDVDLVEDELLEIDWDDGLAFLIKRIQGAPIKGNLIFRGVYLFKQGLEEPEEEQEIPMRAPLEVR